MKTVDGSGARLTDVHYRRMFNTLLKVHELLRGERSSPTFLEDISEVIRDALNCHQVWIGIWAGDQADQIDGTGMLSALATSGFEERTQALWDQLEGQEATQYLEHLFDQTSDFLVMTEATELPHPFFQSENGTEWLSCRMTTSRSTLGVLSICAPSSLTQSPEVRKLIHEIAKDVANALQELAVPKRRDESLRYLHSVIEASGLGTWEWNVQTNETLFNEQISRMLGIETCESSPFDFAQ